jgi:two-component system, OmpR family, phosphate regulon sensor histidine kinase PhoR
LLRVASLDANNVSLKMASCDINKLLAEIVSQHSSEFGKRRQQLVFDVRTKRISARVDKDFLRMVLEHIIDNAGKYTPPAGTVRVSLAQHDGHVRIEVSDTGIGIAKKDRPKLFHKFSRVDNARTNTTTGTGLGLYWAKKVVDLHGGTIKVKSEIHKGSTFIIDLPVRLRR